MKTKKQLIKQMNHLIQEERKKDLNKKYGKICRYKRVIEIIQGIEPKQLFK